jgi:glycosyltransferase involved in cell wall biosynthesis
MFPNRIPTSPPPIHPVSNDVQRPLLSVMIPTYNCYPYLQKTLESVLQQDTGAENMQIEVVDDCSSDGDVEALVKSVGKGRVSFYRQPQNAGSLRNFETCINRSTGHLVHLLHGDDLVQPGFYQEIEHLFREYPSAGAAFTGLSAIDETGTVLYQNNLVQEEAGIIKDWLLKISRGQYLRTCALVVKRSVYEHIGSYFAVHYGEDWEMFVRIAANYPVAYTPKNLALYRIHNDNISTRSLATGQNIKDIHTVINIIQDYVPAAKKNETRRAALKSYSYYFSSHAQGIYKKHRNSRVALKQAHGALLLHFNKKTITSVIRLYVKVLLGAITHK